MDHASDLSMFTKPSKQLINYINNSIWLADQDRLQLKTINISLAVNISLKPSVMYRRATKSVADQ